MDGLLKLGRAIFLLRVALDNADCMSSILTAEKGVGLMANGPPERSDRRGETSDMGESASSKDEAVINWEGVQKRGVSRGGG